MKRLLYILICITALLGGCKKSDSLDVDITGLGGDKWPATEIDKWIGDSLTAIYNIDVKYRWDAFELALDKTLVPPYADKVVPMMRIVKYGLLESYAKAVSEAFIKTYCPKQYYLVGSPSYNTNGTITVGEAENGRKVTLFRTNMLDMKDSVFVKRIMKTIHHEFGHILQHYYATPKEYALISAGSYGGDWEKVTEDNARSVGFITPYAMSEPNEDFVEMIAVMLSEGKASFDNIVSNQNSSAQPILRRKEQMVVDFYRQYYNIDFYHLQQVTREQLDLLIP